MRGGAIVGRTLAALAVAVLLRADAQAQPYGWVDDQGNTHYVQRRDQVPERYRSQLGPAQPAKPRVAPKARRQGPTGCVLRIRATERGRGASLSYPTCEECLKALDALPPAHARRAECFATSMKNFR